MIGTNPAAAPGRDDLPWLRHRSQRSVTARTVPARIDFSRPGRSTHTDTPRIDMTHPGRSRTPKPDLQRTPKPDPQRTPKPAPKPAPQRTPKPAPKPAPQPSSLDLSGPPPAAPPLRPTEPAPSSSLDLSGPPPAAPPARSPAPPTSSLDLSAPAPAPPTPAPSSTTLDLGGGPAAPPAHTLAPARPAPVRRPDPRLEPQGREILSLRRPTVTLNRVQSGIGTLTIDAVCSPAVGDLRLVALYQLTDETSSLVGSVRGTPEAPAGSRHPVLRSSRGEHERLTVDLRQSRALQRLLVVAFSESGRELDWGGTLLIQTFGGARLEVPMDIGSHHGPVAVLSLYNVDGEYVLRSELAKVHGPTREVARLWGYDLITWADDETPLG